MEPLRTCSEFNGFFSKSSKNLFWNLETKRALESAPWEERLSQLSGRKADFLSSCQEQVAGLNLKNMKVCESMFQTMLENAINVGKDWKENWERHRAGILERWQNFNAECSKIQLQAQSCEKVFFESIEPAFYSHGNPYNIQVQDLSSFWEKYKKEACAHQAGTLCELSFWQQFVNRIKQDTGQAEKSDCVPADQFKGLSYMEMLKHEKLDANCETHAALILELEKGADQKTCRKNFPKIIAAIPSGLKTQTPVKNCIRKSRKPKRNSAIRSLLAAFLSDLSSLFALPGLRGLGYKGLFKI